MFQRESGKEDYLLYKEHLTAYELFDIWWRDDWKYKDVFISNEVNSAPESMYFLPEILGKLQPFAKRDLRFSIYRLQEQRLVSTEKYCKNCENYNALYMKSGDRLQSFKYGYCLLLGETGEGNVRPEDRPVNEKCFSLRGGGSENECKCMKGQANM